MDAGVAWQPAPVHHSVQFYESDSFLCDVVARFAAGALAREESVVIIATDEHRRATAALLAERGFDVERLQPSGRLSWLDAAETLARFMVDGAPDRARFVDTVAPVLQRARASSGSGRVSAFGEMVDLLRRGGAASAALTLECHWNELSAAAPFFSLLCGYAMSGFSHAADGEDLESICAAHTRVIPTESYSALDEPELRRREVTILQQRAHALATEVERRKEIEQALTRAREEAESANRAKDEFLAMLGHELRNPLAPIVTALQLMKLRGEARSTKEQDIIERQVQYLVRLVDDLLDVSRITRGKLELRQQRVDLRDAIARAVETASPLLEQRRQHFEVSVPRERILVHADEGRLAQVFANLLTNAAKYTPPGGHIGLTMRREREQVIVEVADDGIGIPPELLPRVFDLFVQGWQSPERSHGGLGIGLSLVRTLVSMHGGEVEAHSDGPGLGSRFVVRLETIADEQTVEPTPALAAAPPTAGAATSARRILVVDDNSDALELLVELLRGCGHEVQPASDGPSAIEVVRSFRPELAILDIGLPAMDGYELAARLRADFGGALRLVALSGYGQQHDRARSRLAGFDSHRVKPVDIRALIDIVERDTNA